MEKKVASGIMLALLLLIGTLTLAFNTSLVKAESATAIYIRPDGSVDPATAPIQRVGNVYTFTADIYETIVVQRFDITIDGNGYTLQGADISGSYGFYLYDLPGRVTITRTNIERFTYAIWVHGPMGGQPSIFITGNTITNNGNSISLNGGYPFFASITGNTITNNSGGISLNTAGGDPHISPPAYIKDNTIANNGGGVSVSGFAPPHITGNTIRNNGGGVSVSVTNPVYGASITGNNITNNAGGVSVSGGYTPSGVSGNIITNNGGGVSVSGVMIDIYRNTIANNSGGISLNEFISDDPYSMSGASIIGNTITNNSGGASLTAFKPRLSLYYYMFPPHITGNTLANNGGGMSVSGFSFVREAYYGASITGNNMTNNEYYGVYLNSSDYSSVSRNTITDSPRGIQYSSSDNNTVFGNTITNNGYGVYLYESSDNKFYHNNFVNNTSQVFDESWTNATVRPSLNTWDRGYTFGGNYWSDYTNVNLYSGYYQNITGSDAIWDHPYIIDAYNQDRYPLVNPWTPETTHPIANAGPDQTVYEDATVTFDGSGSSDNVGIVSYVWTFTDVTPQTLTGVKPTYTFTTPGVLTVTLTVTDAAENWATDTVVITVLELPPEQQLIQRLIETIQTWKLPRGTENSLTSKLEEALHLLEVGNENGATHSLMEFISQAEALEGKKLTSDQANYLIYQAQEIMDRIKE